MKWFPTSLAAARLYSCLPLCWQPPAFTLNACVCICDMCAHFAVMHAMPLLKHAPVHRIGNLCTSSRCLAAVGAGTTLHGSKQFVPREVDDGQMGPCATWQGGCPLGGGCSKSWRKLKPRLWPYASEGPVFDMVIDHLTASTHHQESIDSATGIVHDFVTSNPKWRKTKWDL